VAYRAWGYAVARMDMQVAGMRLGERRHRVSVPQVLSYPMPPGIREFAHC